MIELIPLVLILMVFFRRWTVRYRLGESVAVHVADGLMIAGVIATLYVASIMP